MKITVHRETETTLYGVIAASGQWVMRERAADGWLAIDPPAWATEKPAKPTPELAHPMTDPYERQTLDVPMLTVQRTVTKTVPDYEAEILLRSGWELVQ